MKINFKSFEVIIDENDHFLFKKYFWYLSHGYLVYKTKSRTITFHREILNLKDSDIIVDHINMNKLDNRKCNLRIASKSKNAMNRNAPKQNTSGYKGVSWRLDRKKWRAYIVLMGKQYSLGLFDKKEDAAMSYNDAAIKYHGEFARLNKILT